MFKLILAASFIFCAGFISIQAQITIKEGVGVSSIKVGTSTFSDVVSAYGKDYSLIDHNQYTYEIRYPNGLSFYYFYDDADKKIFSIHVGAPFEGFTEKGIVIGKSTVGDVFRLYGFPTIIQTVNRETPCLMYKGIYFYTESGNLLDVPNKESFKQRKITAFDIETAASGEAQSQCDKTIDYRCPPGIPCSKLKKYEPQD